MDIMDLAVQIFSLVSCLVSYRLSFTLLITTPFTLFTGGCFVPACECDSKLQFSLFSVAKCMLFIINHLYKTPIPYLQAYKSLLASML